MNWNDWYAFTAVARSGSFTRAAEQLGWPKSSVSHAVARLEQALGQRLIERSTRRLMLTEQGQRLLAQLAPLFERLDAVAGEAGNARDEPRGVLRIATPYEFGALQLGEVVNDVLTRHPGLRIELEVRVPDGDDMGAGFDVVFFTSADALPDSQRVVRRVYSVARGVYAAPAVVHRHGLPRTVAELQAWPCLSTPGEAWWRFQGPDGRTQEIQPQGPLRTNNAALRLQAALAGHGAAMLAASYCRREVEAGALVPLLPEHAPHPLKVYAQLPGRGLVPARTRVFMEAVDRFLAD
ncbi:LysR family transcriptional regulator [Azohydromonas caseinilytica]|uniref:LysR family transcriptional regulator n=1 Tax=Azohydromonas caseinilytica TaxID=2728836 RepID=A0A848FDE1_9BURK|nr:LysR family transcriptional regulator [Azohydromonas caseinilytica]NML16409.1 LysR family transcriptional regulator [Azohydromonas caseinilytica]